LRVAAENEARRLETAAQIASNLDQLKDETLHLRRAQDDTATEFGSLRASVANSEIGVALLRTSTGDIRQRIERIEVASEATSSRSVQGSTIALLSLGTRLQECLKAADELGHYGLSVTVADARFAKPLDTHLVERLAGLADIGCGGAACAAAWAHPGQGGAGTDRDRGRSLGAPPTRTVEGRPGSAAPSRRTRGKPGGTR